MSNVEIITTIIQQFPYALAGSMIAGLLCAFLGVYVVSKRVVFVSATLTEVAVAGVAFANLVGGLHPTVGSVLLTSLAVLLFARLLRSTAVPSDAILGISYIVALTIRILMMQKTSGAEVAEVESILKGDMLLVTPAHVTIMAVTAAIILLIHLVFFRQFLFVSMDAETARTQGIRSGLWEFVFYLTLAVAVSTAVRIVGDLFVFGFLVIPSTAAMLAAKRVGRIFLTAAVFGALPPILGLFLAFKFDFPAGPATVASAFVLLLPWVVLKR